MKAFILEFSHKKLLAFVVFAIFFVTPMSAVGLASQPTYLVTVDDLSPNTWTKDVSYAQGQGWYIDFGAPNGAMISITPQDFSSQAQAIQQVSNANKTSLQVQATGLMNYAFPNFRFDLSAVSSGFAWEILSPCCYSRGVSFSIGNTYVHIFGSQSSKWSDLVYVYNKQVVKLEQYYNIPVSQQLLQEINQYEQGNTPNGLFNLNSTEIAGIFLIGVLPVVAIAIAIYSPLKKKLKNSKK